LKGGGGDTTELRGFAADQYVDNMCQATYMEPKYVHANPKRTTYKRRSAPKKNNCSLFL
jgi:hypothetical protein